MNAINIKYCLQYIKKHKWIMHWTAFALMVIIFIVVAIVFENKKWIGNALQTIGSIAGVYATILVFSQTKQGSDEQFKKQIEHLQIFNAKQIEALQLATDKQINEIQKQNNLYIEALFKATEKQIEALQKTTEKQIEVLQKTTYEQIQSFETQIQLVANKLSDNSVLLAEILSRELEKSINVYTLALKNEEAKYADISGWKLLRSPLEKKEQLEKQWSRIQEFKKWLEFLVNKHHSLKGYLGIK